MFPLRNWILASPNWMFELINWLFKFQNWIFQPVNCRIERLNRRFKWENCQLECFNSIIASLSGKKECLNWRFGLKNNKFEFWRGWIPPYLGRSIRYIFTTKVMWSSSKFSEQFQCITAVFTVTFSHLHYSLNVDVRQFQVETAELPEIASHPRSNTL